MARTFLALLLSFFVLGAAAQEKYSVIVQVSDDDPAKWNLALNNVAHIVRRQKEGWAYLRP